MMVARGRWQRHQTTHLPSHAHHDGVDRLEHGVAIQRYGVATAVCARMPCHHQPEMQHHNSAIVQFPCSSAGLQRAAVSNMNVPVDGATTHTYSSWARGP